ncbi:MAG TPA: hypothetical protein VEW03_10860, partial [Longimicrobiaceae bacterium]|nr:hypothetical protein [Longimicrobiaceae bacterium]
MHPARALAAATLVLLPLAPACSSPTPADGGEPPPRFGSPVALPILGLGEVPQRTTSELWVHGRYAYTGTHGNREGNLGNVIYVWDVAGPRPVLLDSLRVPDPPPGPAFHLEGEDEGHTHATAPDRVGDLQVSDDGRLLLAATEG